MRWTMRDLLVTMGELALTREVHKIAPPNFKKGIYKHACAVEGDLLTLRMEEQETQTLFVET